MFGFGETWDISKDIPDLDQKVAIVTGGNAGIGFEIVKALAIRGAKVYLAARSEERAKDAIKKIEASSTTVEQAHRVIWLPLDLTQPEDAVKAAQQFIKLESRLDILVCNAARLAAGYEKTNYGIEKCVAINHVGHFAFVQTLLPLLKSTSESPGADVRIAIMSSRGHTLIPKIHQIKTKEDLNEPWPNYSQNESYWGQLQRYGFSKLLNELFKIELQNRLNQEAPKIIVLSMHPGNVNTENVTSNLPFVLRMMFVAIALSPELGAKSALVAATSPEIRRHGDAYKASHLWPNGKRHGVSAQARDKMLASDLWNLTQQIVDEELGEKVQQTLNDEVLDSVDAERLNVYIFSKCYFTGLMAKPRIFKNRNLKLMP